MTTQVAPTADQQHQGGPLTGLRPLLAASLRQDTRLIVPWIAGVSALAMSSVLAFNILFNDPTTKAEFITSVGANPAFNLIFGPPQDLSTVEGFTSWRSLTLGGFFVSLMAILIVIRNSRANEDSGQAELIASGVVGRSARLAVAVAMALIASAAAGVVASVGLVLLGGDATSSIALGATFTASGFMFAALAAVTAQVASDARAAGSLAIGILGGAFLLRGALDTASTDGSSWWLSPLGWTQRVAPGTENNWWPLLACLGLTAALVVFAFLLQNRRDFGQGLIPARPGPASGGAAAHLWGFTIRLNRSAIVSWTVGLLIVGGVFGLLSTTMIEVIQTNPAIAQLLAGGAATYEALALGLIITLIDLLTIIAALYGVGVANRVHSEEVAYRVEPLLAGQLSRSRYLLSNAAVALLGPAVALLAATVVIGSIAAGASEPVTVGAVLTQGVLALPALWLLIGIGLAAVAVRPQLRLVAWIAIVATFGLTLLGPSFRLPDWALAISPLWHVPNLESPGPDYAGLLVTLALAALLVGVAFIGFRRRDIV